MPDPIRITPGAMRAPARAVPLGGDAAAVTPPPNARTSNPSQRTLDRWGRQAALIAQARSDAHAEGERTGFQGGWRRGLWAGAVAGALLTSIGWAVWLTATAPDAAPPSAAAQARPSR